MKMNLIEESTKKQQALIEEYIKYNPGCTKKEAVTFVPMTQYQVDKYWNLNKTNKMVVK